MLPFSAISLRYVTRKPLPYEAVGTRLQAWLEHAFAAGFLSDGGALGRYSYLLAQPIAQGKLAYDDPRETADFLREVTAFLPDSDTPITPDHEQWPPFTGGLIGMASFELGLRLEDMKRRPFRIEGRKPWPELVALCYPAVLVFDHHARTLTAIGRGATLAEAEAARDALADLYAATPIAEAPSGPFSDGPLQLETPDEVHEDKVAALIQQIHAGDLFQANLARGWSGKLKASVTPGQVMSALHTFGPAPFGGFLSLGERCILSNSPERFIRLDSAGDLETRPIKGTRPRGKTPDQDSDFATELTLSEKDRAENLMIVDLMRHDLSRVAEVGSVKVTALHALESYPNVHHLVSTVTARLSPGKTAADVLCATFPPGSISGAPKVQAMKVIYEMEAARGPYCGSLFFIDAKGAMDSNVLIRTLALERDDEQRWHVRACAGGGIVADSEPVSERIETETKLSLIKRVLEG
jgi:para-aminobenzoate synthetase component 1